MRVAIPHAGTGLEIEGSGFGAGPEPDPGAISLGPKIEVALRLQFRDPRDATLLGDNEARQ